MSASDAAIARSEAAPREVIVRRQLGGDCGAVCVNPDNTADGAG